jgi:hypothetical protein
MRAQATNISVAKKASAVICELTSFFFISVKIKCNALASLLNYADMSFSIASQSSMNNVRFIPLQIASTSFMRLSAGRV